MKYCDKSTSRLNNMPMSTTLLDEEQTILFASTFTSLTHEHGDRKTRETSVKLPLSRKLCYAVGAAPYQMTNIAIGFSLQIFLLDVVQMEAFSVSLILFISHVWDAVTDPLVGYLVSRSKWTQIGKLMPWAVLSTPLVILSYIFLWLIPFRATSSAVSVPWFLTISCLFETFMSCYSVPYITLSMFLGGDQQHRDSATAYRTSVEAFSMLMAAVIQGQVLWVFNKERDQACLNAEQTPDLPHTALHESRKAFMFSALVMSSLFFVCCMVLFLGVKEQKGPLSTHMNTTYLNAMKKLIGHRSFQRLLLAFFCSTLAFQLLIPALVVLVSTSDNFPVYLLMCVVIGSSLASLFLLPWSMLPDVVDEFAVLNPSCEGLEPLFFSCWRFFNKLGGGLCAGISTLALHFTGYKAGACSQPDEVVLALKLLLAPVPVTFLLVGLVFFYLYPINEARQKQIQQHLRRLRLNCVTIPTLEEDTFPQVYNSSQNFQSKTRKLSPHNANKSSQAGSSKSANSFLKSTACPTPSQQHNSSHESMLRETHVTLEHALKYPDVPDERSRVTWV
ncbi:sodium-dependent lysophosphatidylcholine symporter 1-B-like isoform X1 [Danio rerio]|uniref:Sodium-dependent lysophosphatidylcholine symporter 1-B-like isoform X1 n=1 Tax=Danio rerio TaxID=7955 RepID=A0AC58G810_DANRE|nr:uncharacterized protein LOC571061 isoform X4 [Danio rerio]|eukprot:XP_009302559.1 uncharacterized protein LOC571061 isoform X4 [Danio rerio]